MKTIKQLIATASAAASLVYIAYALFGLLSKIERDNECTDGEYQYDQDYYYDSDGNVNFF